MKRLVYLLLLILLFAGCKSSKQSLYKAPVPQTQYLSSKMQFTVPNGSNTMTVGGTMKMKTGERIQLSVLMPVLRSELFRLDITPTDILIVDRMNKRYVKTTREELVKLLPQDVQFAQLEKLLLDAAKPGGKSEVTGSELGIPSMEKAKVRLYDFSEKEFDASATSIPARYTEISLDELIKMLSQL